MSKAFHSTYYDPARLAKLGNLQLLARTVVEGYISGLHRSPFKGFSAEFAEYREYLAGDDLKHFDWKVFARSDRKYVREYEEETNMTCTLVLDASSSMSYRSDATLRSSDPSLRSTSGISKLAYGCYLAAALTYLMVQQRDQVGLVIADEAVRERIPPRSSPAHMKYILDRLERVAPKGRTGLAKCLHPVVESLKRRGLVIIISDLMDEPDAVMNLLQHFRHERHEIIVFHVLDNAEIEFPFQGLIEFRDAETRERMQLRAEVIREAYCAKFNEFVERYRRECTKAKIDYHLVNTQTPFELMLAAYLRKRER
jgi:uncharacterized protein (DUF58 family)